MPHLRETCILDQAIHWLQSLETTCNTSFLLPSLQERVIVQLLIWEEFQKVCWTVGGGY